MMILKSIAGGLIVVAMLWIIFAWIMFLRRQRERCDALILLDLRFKYGSQRLKNWLDDWDRGTTAGL